MKKLIITTIIALLTVAGITAKAEEWPKEYLGLPGDNLNLFAVMKLFQESETLESFERSLNNENLRINNLDLNGDNIVDYIMVLDYVDGNVHNIVLRVALNQYENQDIAVFTVQQFENGQVEIQLVGDEALYGKNYIIEPIYAETPNPGYVRRAKAKTNTVVINKITYTSGTWPLIRFIYLPGYVTWRSSWYWGYRPNYWNPWRPYYWHTYYGYHYHWQNYYYKYYRQSYLYRYSRYNDFYYSNVRVHSPTIIVNINSGRYNSTYSRPDLRSKGTELYTTTTRNTKSSQPISSGTGVRRSENSPASPATSGRSQPVRRSTTGSSRSSINSQAAKESQQRPSSISKKSSSGSSAIESQKATRRSTGSGSSRTDSGSPARRETLKSAKSGSSGVPNRQSTQRSNQTSTTRSGSEQKSSQTKNSRR